MAGHQEFLKSALKYPYFAIPEQYRSGVKFIKAYYELNQSQWWPREKQRERQLKKLTELLKHAYEEVPFYRKLYRNVGFAPGDLKCLEDMGRLPTISKEDLRESKEELVSEHVPRRSLKYYRTSGTSGMWTALYLSKENEQLRRAFDWRAFNWMGYFFGNRCAVLRGTRTSDAQGRPTLWQDDKEHGCLLLSSFDLAPTNLPTYLGKICEYEPKIIRGLPSALEVLARYAIENGLRINRNGSIKALGTSSENLFDRQRMLLERAFECPVFDLYGNTEQVARLAQCEERAGYHIFEEYAFVELITEDGKCITDERVCGEIVGTAFTNSGMPLIRYRTEDYAMFCKRECDCGRKGLRLLQGLQGRRFQEQILTRSGPIAISALLAHEDFCDNILQIQYYQDRIDEVTVRLVRKPGYKEEDTRKIRDHLEARLSGRIVLRIVFVEEIPRTDRGKYKYLIQKIPGERPTRWMSDR